MWIIQFLSYPSAAWYIHTHRGDLHCKSRENFSHCLKVRTVMLSKGKHLSQWKQHYLVLQLIVSIIHDIKSHNSGRIRNPGLTLAGWEMSPVRQPGTSLQLARVVLGLMPPHQSSRLSSKPSSGAKGCFSPDHNHCTAGQPKREEWGRMRWEPWGTDAPKWPREPQLIISEGLSSHFACCSWSWWCFVVFQKH